MVKINGDVYLKTFYIPCGNLSQEYLDLQMKLKIMQMLTFGQVDIAYLADEIGMSDFLSMLKEEYDPEIAMAPTGGMSYDKDSETYVMEFKVMPTTPYVDMESYLLLDTERFMALAVYLEVDNPDDGEEYIVGPNSLIDYKTTFLEMQQEVIRWLQFMDISQEGTTLQDILSSFTEFVVGVVYIGEVAIVIFDTLELFGEDWYNSLTETPEPVLDYGVEGSSNQNIMLGFDNKAIADFANPDIDINDTDDKDWSSF